MKLKYIFAAVTLSGVLTLGIGVSVASVQSNASPVEAAVTQTSEYYLTGSNYDWGDGYQLFVDDSSSNKGQLVNYSFTAGETIKFKKAGSWDNALGWYQLDGGSAKNAFELEGGDNIKVLIGGKYSFYITDNSRIYVELEHAVDIYVQIQDWNDTCVYAFDETTKSGTTLKPLGEWPGKRATDVTASTNFNGSLGGIARISIPYHTLNNTKIIISNNGSSQSGNKPLGNHYYYLKSGTSYSASDGAEAKVVFDIERAIESTGNKSVCQVSKADASTLVSEYDSLSSKAKVNASTYWTWNSTVNDEKTNHTYSELVQQLRAISTGNKLGLMNISGIIDGSNVHIVIVTIVAIVSVTAVGGYYFIRKRKENQ